MKKLRALIISVVIVCAMMAGTAMAAGNLKILATNTGEDCVSIYVKGADATAEVTAQVGTADANSVSATVIGDLPVPMKTLIMLDNSISIVEADRKKIAELMQDMISDRMASEQIAIATFSEGTTYLCDFTDDYAELKAAVEGIEYQNQETYLTDVLCDLISTDFADSDEDVFRRIIIISDGVDNKSLGKTRDDLNKLMSQYVFPIYSIGCYNKSKSNNEQLENMFSISSQSNAEYYLLSDYDNVIDITTALRSDREVVKYLVVPSADQMDGGTKAVKLGIGSETITVQCTMPQKIKVVETAPDEEPVQETVAEPVVESTEEFEEETMEIPWMLIGIVGGSVFVLILIVVVILICVNNKKKREFRQPEMDLINEFDNRDVEPFDSTVLINNNIQQGDGDSTVMIWNNNETYHINLTDVSSPARTISIPLTGSVTIGRKPGCDAVFDYDKSVSGRHCEISVRNGHFFLKDLQSSNGTFVNGSKILTEAELFSGNIIKLGRVEIRFEVR